MQRNKRRKQAANPKGSDGIDYVRCRICGDHRRVISGRHLSKHGIDREAYMEDYHLSPDELIAKDFRQIRSSLRGFYPYGKRDWMNAIKRIYKREGKVFAGFLQRKFPYIYRQGVWIFGDWDKALCAAGFEPRRMRLHGFWTRERVVEEIHAIQTKSLPLNAKYMMKSHARLFSGAQRHYGSWNQALLAAGIEAPKNANSGRLGTLRALRDALEEHAKGDIPRELKITSIFYFGSLPKAIAALKTEPKFMDGWSKLKITKTLSRMYRSKKNLAYT